MDEARSAAAQAGICDERLLVMDVLAALVGATTISECVDIWMSHVRPVEKVVCEDTLDDLSRGMCLGLRRIVER